MPMPTTAKMMWKASEMAICERGEESDHRLSGCEPIVDCPYVASSLKARTRQPRTETPSGQSGSCSAGG